MNAFNSNLLRLVREQKGWSQSFLAQNLGVKQAVLSKYENSVIDPPEEMRNKIAAIFNYPVSFFEQKVGEIPSGLVFHRKRASLPVAVRGKIEAEVRLRLLDIIILAQDQNPGANIIQRKQMSPEETAIALRKHWKVSAGPIANLAGLLESNGIVVIAFDFNSDKLDGFFIRLDSGLVAIALNTNDAFSPDRNRFTLAHELGHALLHRDVLPDKTTENEADAFATELLMPQEDITSDFTAPLSFAYFLQLKTKWKVSIGALLYRANKLELMSPFVYRRFWMFMSSSGYRKNEPRCGIERETPILLDQMLAAQRQKTTDLPKLFHLTESVFAQRYPEYTHLNQRESN